MPENLESSWHLRVPDDNPFESHLRITPPAKHTSDLQVRTLQDIHTTSTPKSPPIIESRT